MNRAQVPSENVTSKYFQMLTCQQKNELYSRQIFSNAPNIYRCLHAKRSNNSRTGYKQLLLNIWSMPGILIYKKVRLPNISKFEAKSKLESQCIAMWCTSARICPPFNMMKSQAEDRLPPVWLFTWPLSSWMPFLTNRPLLTPIAKFPSISKCQTESNQCCIHSKHWISASRFTSNCLTNKQWNSLLEQLIKASKYDNSQIRKVHLFIKSIQIQFWCQTNVQQKYFFSSVLLNWWFSISKQMWGRRARIRACFGGNQNYLEVTVDPVVVEPVAPVLVSPILDIPSW